MNDPLALLTPAAESDAPPPVLLDYQKKWVADQAQLRIAAQYDEGTWVVGEALIPVCQPPARR